MKQNVSPFMMWDTRPPEVNWNTEKEMSVGAFSPAKIN